MWNLSCSRLFSGHHQITNRLPKLLQRKFRFPVVILSNSFGQPAAQTHPHLVKQGEVTPGISKCEYRTRRDNLVKLACSAFKDMEYVKDHILIFPASAKTFMTYDIPYPFRQNTEFLYLCGFQEPDSVLILHTNQQKSSITDYLSVLFVPKKDPSKELWDGPRSGREGALTLTGVDKTLNVDSLEEYLSDYCGKFNNYVLWYNYSKPTHMEHDIQVLSQFMKENRHKCIENTVGICNQLRLIKSPAEIELMKQSVEIASKSFIEVMKFSRPEVKEAHLYAKMDFECRIRDAEFLAYPPVVAGGNRANTIHYINNNQIVRDGELVLMDAGCEFHGYTSDITRTWPVSGKFSSSQRQLYDAVLTVQEQCVELCTLAHSLDDIYKVMLKLLGKQLQLLGIIPADIQEVKLMQKTREFCPHHVSHYLGMDVHDTSEISRGIKLSPGMIVTIEPGIYIPESHPTAPAEFQGMGIRIEDDVLVTEGAPVVLSQGCPKTVEDIEHIMAQS
ncbi:xaa-Pro aminopeptidase 3-like [Haliotis asinina]|uniref:xaa-Pro aminopeptidase 3-like n=1 Tax=Haliotis asinina TaxID=109174 RepID=UPI0035327865